MRVSMRFDTENSFSGQFPEFGAIFMSNTDTKKECFRRKLLGLPSGQSNFVKEVKTGMILFLFEFERRELHGVFQACSDGAMNIVPSAYKSSGREFPAQVKFTPIWHCNPLPESEFREAIRENYFSRNKFNFGLSEKQVKRLLTLFRLRKLNDKHFDRHFTQKEVASQTKTRSGVDYSGCITVNAGENEENAKASFESISNEGFKDCINHYISAIDADMKSVGSVGHERKADIDCRMLISDKRFGNVPGTVGRSENLHLLTSDVAGEEHNVHSSPGSVGLNQCPAQPLALISRPPKHVSNAMISEQEIQWDNQIDFLPISSVQTCLKSGDSSKYTSGDDSLINDQLPNNSAMHLSVAPPNLNVSHLISHRKENTFPYNPDFPAFNYMNSSLPHVALKSVPESSTDNSIFPCIGFQSASECMGSRSRSRSPILDSDVSNNRSVSCTNLGNITYSRHMYSESTKKHKSVFSRLTFPSDFSEQRVGCVEYGTDSSVDEVMAILHHCRLDWLKKKGLKKLVRRQDDLKKRRQAAVNGRLSKHSLADTLKDSDRLCISSCEKKEIHVEQMPSIDFKRRSDIQKRDVGASGQGHKDCVESSGLSNGSWKKRRLVRPNFSADDLDHCPLNGGREISNSMEHNFGAEKLSTVFQNSEAGNDRLPESVTTQCNASMGGVGCGSTPEPSEGT